MKEKKLPMLPIPFLSGSHVLIHKIVFEVVVVATTCLSKERGNKFVLNKFVDFCLFCF